MAPPAINDLPQPSPLEEALEASKTALQISPHPAYLHHLASTIIHNLQYQHEWNSLEIHTHSPMTKKPLPRPIISGLPPKRAYIHPDEQIATLKAEHESGEKIQQFPELEWVLPTQIQENWSLAKFSAVFDALDVVPPSKTEEVKEDDSSVGHQWRGKNRQKRLLLATLNDDSTVVYYIVHDGIVKPRQN